MHPADRADPDRRLWPMSGGVKALPNNSFLISWRISEARNSMGFEMNRDAAGPLKD
jgi:hypothetical protein